MSLIVQKFGGSSLATPKLIRIAANHIRATKEAGHQVVVVASAMGDTTDHLIRLAKKTVQSPSSRELDMLLTAGERVSMSLLAMVLAEQKVPAISFTGSQSGILTTEEHGHAKILEIRPQRIHESLNAGRVVIVAGFQGVSRTKEITTLGRGGSDTSAVALAAQLGADRCDILTDVEGLFTADPRMVPRARLLPALDYSIALEMARLGAKMHARSLEVAKRFGVKVRILKSGQAQNLGTLVESIEKKNRMETLEIVAIPTRPHLFFFQSTSTPDQLANFRIEMLHVREGETSFLVDSAEKNQVESALGKVGTPVTLVSLVGDGLLSRPTLISEIWTKAKELDAPILMLSSNTLSISLAVPPLKAAELAKSLHQTFLE